LRPIGTNFGLRGLVGMARKACGREWNARNVIHYANDHVPTRGWVTGRVRLPSSPWRPGWVGPSLSDRGHCISPGHKHKYYDDITHTSSDALLRQGSGWGQNDDRYRYAPTPAVGLPPMHHAADSDCDWLKQVKCFTAGAFCFGWNKTVLKLFCFSFKS